MRTFIVSILIVFMISSPPIAQELTDRDRAIVDAKRDVQDIDALTWTLVGCFGGAFGTAFAYVTPPNVPATKILGKSPEYVAYYTDTYQADAREKRTRHAVSGLCCRIW